MRFIHDVEEDGGIDCPHCDGSGTIDEASEEMVRNHMRQLYEDQAKDDAKKLAAWNNAMHELHGVR